MNKNEKIIVITSAVFCAVVFMHLLRVVFGVDLSIAGVEISLWASVAGAVLIGLLAFANIKMIPVWTRAHWFLFIAILLFIDAGGTGYSYFTGLSYWNIPNIWFGIIALFEIIIASILLKEAKK